MPLAFYPPHLPCALDGAGGGEPLERSWLAGQKLEKLPSAGAD